MFMPVPILNGFLREKILKNYLSDLSAHQVSTVLLSIFLLVFMWLIYRDDINNASATNLLLIGLVWVGLTVLFEFYFGFFVEKFPLQRLLADYNLISGRVWPLFLGLMLIAPTLLKKLKLLL